MAYNFAQENPTYNADTSGLTFAQLLANLPNQQELFAQGYKKDAETGEYSLPTGDNGGFQQIAPGAWNDPNSGYAGYDPRLGPSYLNQASWFDYAQRNGLNPDYSQATQPMKDQYQQWVNTSFPNVGGDNVFVGGLKDLAKNFVLPSAALGLGVAGAGALAGGLGALGGGAAAAPGWVSAEGGAGYLGGMAADSAALGGVAGGAAGAAAGADQVGSDWALGQATGAPGGLLPTTAEGLTAANGAGLGSTLLDAATKVPTSALTQGADQVGSDWATGQMTGAPGGLLPTTAGGLTAANGAGLTSTAASFLSKIMNGTATPEDYLSAALRAAPGVIGAITSNQQQNALQGIADQQVAQRAPFLAKATQYTNDPNSFYGSNEGGAAADAVLRKLSIGGNPADNPTKLAAATNGLYSNYQNAVNSFGSLGLSGQAGVLSSATNAVNQSGITANDLGNAFTNVFNPQQPVPDWIKQLGNINWNSGSTSLT